MVNNRKRRACGNAKDEKEKQLSKGKNRGNDVSEKNPCPFRRSPAFSPAIEMSYDREKVEYIIQSLPLDCIQDILTWMPLSNVFGMLCHLGTLSEIVWTSPQFQNEWDERNKEMCLVANHSDVVSMVKSSEWIWSEDILHDWINNSIWSLRAAAGGFLVFINEEEGKLQAVNLLTMKAHQIPDAEVNSIYGLSYYIKKHPKEVGVELREVLRTKSCEVIVIGNFTYKKLHILIYSLTTKSWELKVPQNSVSLRNFSKILVHNGKVYCFSEDFRSWASYRIHEEERGRIVHFSNQAEDAEALNKALFVRKDIIMKFELQSSYQYAILVLDETINTPLWWCRYKVRMNNLCILQFRLSENFLVTSGGDNDADDIWILFEGNNRIMSVDPDARKILLWECPSMNNLTSKNSKLFCMPLKFSQYT